MAWLDFIKQIRRDEEEEQKRGGGVQNKVFGFLDDVLDVGDRRVDRLQKAFSPSDEEDYDIGNRVQDVVGGIVPEFHKDLLGTAAGAFREMSPKVGVALGQELETAGDRAATGAITKSVDQLKALSYDERKKAIEDNPGLKLVLERQGVTDPSDKNLDDIGKDRKSLSDTKTQGVVPTGTLAKAVLGNEPIQSYTRREEGREEAGVNPGLSKLATVGLLATDAPGFGTGAKAVKEVSQEGLDFLAKNTNPKEVLNYIIRNTNMAKEEAKKLVDGVVNASTPAEVDGALNAQIRRINPTRQVPGAIDDTAPDRPRISVEDQSILGDYSDYLVGDNPAVGKEANDLIAQVRKVGDKHGVDLTNGSIAERMDRANSILRVVDEKAPTPTIEQVAPTQQFQDIVSQPLGNRVDLQGGPGRQRERSFLQTAQKGPSATPESNAALQSITPQTYAQQAQVPVMEQAKREVDESYDTALAYVKDPASVWDDRKSATLQQLASKARREGREGEFKELLEQIDVEGRGAGRANAILAAWNRLSPDGIVQYAERQVKKFSDESGKGVLNKISKARKGSPEKLAEKIKTEVDEAGDITKDKLKTAIKAITEGGDSKAEKTVGEKVASNIENYMSPQRKKQADELVTELVKKIKQEMIEKRDPVATKSALDVLKGTFARNKEALDAFPEAQQLLREKFADNPAVLKQLDNLLGSTLDIPAAKSTVGRAIKDIMKDQETKIADIIKKSWDNQERSIDDIAEALTKEGFDEASAKAISKEVSDQMVRDIAAAKKSVLDRLLKESPEVARPTFEDKIARLSNLGALDDADYLALAKKQLELPDLDSTTANKLSKLAQDMQGLPDGVEKNKVINDIMDTIAATMPPTAKEKFNAFRYQNLLSSPRTQERNISHSLFTTLITRPATLFTGALGDAASSLTTGKPRERYLNELPEYYKGMVRGFFDANEIAGKSFNIKESSIGKEVRAVWRGESNITNPDLIDQFGKGGVEKARMRAIPKKYTVVSRLMEAQDRMFSGMIAGGEYAVQVKRGIPEAQAKKIADEMGEYSLLRQALDPKNETGQGKMLAGIDQATKLLTDLANFLPGGRWIVPFVRTPLNFGKQWLEFSPVGLANAVVGGKSMSPERRIEALNKGLLGSSVVGYGAMLAADDRTTWSVPTNQADRDLFYAEGKKPYSIKVGDKWIPMIYFGPFGLALSIPASAKHNFTDSPTSLTDDLDDKILNSVLGLGEMMSQQTFLNGIGTLFKALDSDSPDRVEKVLAGLVSQPILLSGLVRYVSTVVDPTYRQAEGFVQQLQKDIPLASRGLEARKNETTGEDVTRNWSDYVAPYSVGGPDKDPVRQGNTEATAEFYRAMSRGGNGRTKVSDEITKALLNKDDATATRLADEFNARLKSEALAVKDKYSAEIERNPDLRQRFNEEYKSRLIKLDSRSRKTRLKNQAKKREFSDTLSR